MEVFLTILLFVLVIILTAVLFAGWVVVMVLRAGMNAVRSVGRLLMGRPRCPQRTIRHSRIRYAKCSNQRCLAANPPEARFCRRCGQPMRRGVQIFARRAAVF